MNTSKEDFAQVDKDKVRNIIKMNNKLKSKFTSMGIKRKSVMIAAADLSDIYYYIDDIKKDIDSFLETHASDWDKLLEIIVDLEVVLGELRVNIIESRKPLRIIAEFCENQMKNTTQQ